MHTAPLAGMYGVMNLSGAEDPFARFKNLVPPSANLLTQAKEYIY